MHTDIEISVIIPIYNEADFLQYQLEALAVQTFQGRWELLLVNNACTDASMEIAEKNSVNFKNVKLKIIDASQKRGRSYALNKGVKASSGKVIIFTDGHTVVKSDWVEKMHAALQNADFVAGGIDVEKLNQAAPSRPNAFTGSKHKLLGFMPYCIGANMGLSRRAFDAVKGFDEEAYYCEDADISFRLQLSGFALHDNPDAIVYFRYRDTVDSMLVQMSRYAFGHVLLYKKFREYGMKRRRLRVVFKEYLSILYKLITWITRTQDEKQLCLRELAARWGRIRGSLYFRCLYL